MKSQLGIEIDTNILYFNEKMGLLKILQEQLTKIERLKINNETTIECQLLYRGSQHNFSASKFHQLCDNLQDILVLIQTQETNQIFGGFVTCGWKTQAQIEREKENINEAKEQANDKDNSKDNKTRAAIENNNGNDKQQEKTITNNNNLFGFLKSQTEKFLSSNNGDAKNSKKDDTVKKNGYFVGVDNVDETFLFVLRTSLDSDVETMPKVLNIKRKHLSKAIKYNINRGPCFGFGNDICITDECDMNNKNYCYSSSYHFDRSENHNTLSGVAHFTVRNYEVFQVLDGNQ